MKLALGSFTFPWAFGVAGYPFPAHPLTPEELIHVAADLEINVVQIAHNVPLDDLARDRELIGSAAKRSGIELEFGTRGTSLNTLRPYVDLSLEFGSTTLRSVPTEAVVIGDLAAEERVVSDVVADLRQLLPFLEQAGVILCLENYEGLPVKLLADIVQRSGSPHVRVCLDTVNSLGRGEGFQTVIDTLADLTGNLHVKDYTVRRDDHWLGFAVQGAPAGEGNLQLNELLARVPDSLTAVLELWTQWQGSIEKTIRLEREWAEQSVRNLRTIVSA